MKQYTIITNEHKGLAGRYDFRPTDVPYVQNFSAKEREEFMNRWEYILKADTRFDPPKCYFINFEKMIIIDITDKLEELKERI